MLAPVALAKSGAWRNASRAARKSRSGRGSSESVPREFPVLGFNRIDRLNVPSEDDCLEGLALCWYRRTRGPDRSWTLRHQGTHVADVVPEPDGRVVQGVLVAQDAQGRPCSASGETVSRGVNRSSGRPKSGKKWAVTEQEGPGRQPPERRAITRSGSPTSAIDSPPRQPSRKRDQPGRSATDLGGPPALVLARNPIRSGRGRPRPVALEALLSSQVRRAATGAG